MDPARRGGYCDYRRHGSHCDGPGHRRIQRHARLALRLQRPPGAASVRSMPAPGFILSEGCAVLIWRAWSTPGGGARIYAEVAGHAVARRV